VVARNVPHSGTYNRPMDRPDPAPPPHFDGRHFLNLEGPRENGFRQFLRWRLTGKKGAWPHRVDNPRQDAPLPDVGPGQLAATFVNHATFLLRAPGLTILTDPIWSERASPVTWAGPKRVRPPGVSFDRLPRVDVVLVSHNHYDHMDIPTLRRLQDRDRPATVTTLGNRAYLEKHGVDNVTELDWWQSWQSDQRLAVTLTPARHFSARGLRDRDRTLWGGFWIAPADAPSVYFAADTGAGVHFSMIRERLGRPDLALLPIGAYEPRWFMSEVHMDPAQAVDAHLTLGACTSLAMHYGTFQMADEPFDAPVRELAEAKRARGVSDEAFALPEPGETVLVSA
jgi:L-ascorbate metabolism protein UlaG (beta-lactamase superfamily)